MKTIFKTYSISQIRAKRDEYQAKTGVEWDWYGFSGGYALSAKVTRNTEMISLDEALSLLPFVGNGMKSQSLLKLSELSGKPLAWVCSAAKTLVANQKAKLVVNRAGNFAGLYK